MQSLMKGGYTKGMFLQEGSTLRNTEGKREARGVPGEKGTGVNLSLFVPTDYSVTIRNSKKLCIIIAKKGGPSREGTRHLTGGPFGRREKGRTPEK